jgi:hypothetical protein
MNGSSQNNKPLASQMPPNSNRAIGPEKLADTSKEKVALDFGLWRNPKLETLERAILCTVAYADVFDYPLTADQIQRYLIGRRESLTTVGETLKENKRPTGIACRDTYFCLSGREEIVETRRRRAQVAMSTWPAAIRYGRMIAGVPFVRMVAVTGALAVDNMEKEGDIDYLVITEKNRLWLCRAMIIQWVVKPAAKRGITICPNYLLSDHALAQFEHNLFTAHEIVQMIPIAGLATYWDLCKANKWAADFLPNSFGHPRHMDKGQPTQITAALVARPLLQLPLGGWLENWERTRKIAKLKSQNGEAEEASFSADQCKGHFRGHGRHIRDALFQRLAALDGMSVI